MFSTGRSFTSNWADILCESLVTKIPGTTVPAKIHQVQETLRSLPKFMSGKCLLTSFSLWSGKDRGRLWQEQFGFDLEGGFEHNSVEQLSYCTCFLRKAGLRLATRVTRALFVAKAYFYFSRNGQNQRVQTQLMASNYACWVPVQQMMAASEHDFKVI